MLQDFLLMVLFKGLIDCLLLLLTILIMVIKRAFDNTNNGDNKVERDSHRKYFLLRVDITNYNVLIHGRNFYDQPINDQIKSMMKLERLQQEKEMITQLE